MVTRVLRLSKSIGSARFLLTVIAHHVHHQTGWAWPSLPTLAYETSYSRRQVLRLIHELEALHELFVERRPGHPNRYRILLDQEESIRGDMDVTGDIAMSPLPVTQLCHPKEIEREKEEAFSLSQEHRRAIARRLGMTEGSPGWLAYVEGDEP
jgi:hypothetical protein